MSSVQTEQQRQAPGINGPAWFDKMMQEYLVRWRSYEPFPFDQPSDTHNYLSLHQNDYLRLSSHPEVIAAKNSANQRSGGAQHSCLPRLPGARFAVGWRQARGREDDPGASQFARVHGAAHSALRQGR